MRELPAWIHVIQMGEAWDDRGSVAPERLQLLIDVVLAPKTPATMALSQGRARSMPKRVEQLGQLIPRSHAHIASGGTLLSFLEKLHPQVIRWMKGWVEGRKFLVADLAIEIILIVSICLALMLVH